MQSEVTVYMNGEELTTTTVSTMEIKNGYTTIECPSCEGTGTFMITKEVSQPCVKCSTRGTLTVSV